MRRLPLGRLRRLLRQSASAVASRLVAPAAVSSVSSPAASSCTAGRRSKLMAEGTMDPYYAAVDAESKLSEDLRVIPWCLRSVLPDELRLTTATSGDHRLIVDQEGNLWMSISSSSCFRKTCAELFAVRAVPPEASLWVVIAPHTSLQDAREIRALVGGPLLHGVCCGIRFMIKNMPLLDSKCVERNQYAELSRSTKDLVGALNVLLKDKKGSQFQLMI